MKTILSALITLPLGFAFAAPALELATIHTVHGKTYQQCKIVQRDPDGVAFTHLKGTARVLFNDLPETTRIELGYNAQAAAELERSREQDRQTKIKERLQQQERMAELRHAARLAEIKRLSQQPIILFQQPSPFAGPVPAVGFATSGWGGGFSWHGRHRHAAAQPRGWDNVGIATIGSGSGGIYVPQSGGFFFTGLPQVHQSPTLGWYNPGFYGSPAMPRLGTFGVVPGLAAPNPPAVVPGVRIPGRASFPVRR
ncbi:hypothetical protein [Prosthecobacter sp.]|uniref:hypothetical protein n=1 Tax=Prosthecobacter sp. TaxID=1965333 RepID=UPI002AB91888|nr:hypothetical protein [Prosthecobacter sp.]MDZ4401944.1 hypothetical protein [Prosthecobacter sp.]